MDDGIKIILFRIALVAGIALFYFLGFDWHFGALLVAWLIMTWVILRTYDDWSSFLKRCMLSLPFVALLQLSLFLTINPEPYTYWYSAALLFDALLLNVPKVLFHYITTFFGVAAQISISLTRKQFDASIDFYTYTHIFLIFFCASYLLILNLNKDSYILVLIKSSIFGMVIVLFSWIFMTSESIRVRHNIAFSYAFGFSCFMGLIFFFVLYNLGKKYFRANSLFKKGKIVEPVGYLMNKLNKEASNTKEQAVQADQAGVCNCCGKDGIPQELLFKINSGQQLCATCRKEMDNFRTR